jgi:group I intron endonuclease
VSKQGYIYVITNSVNGKKYVGKTERTVAIRWAAHKQPSNLLTDLAIARAVAKYGAKNFVITELCKAPVRILSMLETHFILLWNTHVDGKQGYNLTHGGDGVRATKQLRKKMSKSAKKRATTDEGAAHLRRIQAAAHHPALQARKSATHRATLAKPEVKRRMRDTHLAYYASNPEAKARIAAEQKEYTSCPDVRKRLSEQAKKPWSDPVWRAVQTAKRRNVSEETRAKMRTSSAKRWAKQTERAKMSAAQTARHAIK